MVRQGLGFNKIKVSNSNVDAYSVINGLSTKFVVKGNGLVGIGTGNPDGNYMLDVAGKMRACEVRVNNPGWCDYVFAEDYNLMPLSDLKKYLNENKHLPEMPSEALIIEQGGFDLSEMNVALLKRSEENTLYIIEREEKINKLTSAFEAQAKMLEDLSNKTQDHE